MKKPKYFKTLKGKLSLPVFFPDATSAIVRTVDSHDLETTKTPGILVNTYHLYLKLGKKVLKNHQGIRNFMSYQGAVISDSGGFQVMSLAKREEKNNVTDQGVHFKPLGSKKILFTPEISISFQMLLKPDMLVVLDDFTPPNASYKQAKETVQRTILWAKKSKQKFEKICKTHKLTKATRPYLLAVVQGGEYLDLRKKCLQELVKIGFDGLGYGGWPITKQGKFNYQVAKTIANNSPSHYFLFGLGIGKPEEIVNCTKLGFHIFDCVLPTRDARHKRLYIFNSDSIANINLHNPHFYSYYTPDKEKYYNDTRPVSTACNCLLCTRYSRSYLSHLFKIGDPAALRLATIHNLRFYSILMEKLAQ